QVAGCRVAGFKLQVAEDRSKPPELREGYPLRSTIPSELSESTPLKDYRSKQVRPCISLCALCAFARGLQVAELPAGGCYMQCSLIRSYSTLPWTVDCRPWTPR